MKYAILLAYTFLVLISGCSPKEVVLPAQNSRYFVGTWLLKKQILTETSQDFPMKLTFHADGHLATNMRVTGQPDPDYRWSYNEQTQELTLHLLQVDETYRIQTASQHEFTAQQTETNNVLTLLRDQ